MLLAGDVGGTKTNLAIFSAEQGPRAPLVERTFPSNQYSSLEAVLQEFMSQVDYPVEQATFGVAGPVVEGRATITNLSWIIREKHLQEMLGVASVRLLNDLEAIAIAVPVLQAGDLHTLNRCVPEPGGTIAVIAPGTGLGEAYLTWDGTGYQAHPSEGGHADFGPTDALELDLLRYLMERLDHVSYEWVCSGKGIPNIYAYLKDTGYAREPDWLAEQLVAASDATPVIISTALNDPEASELCTTTLKMFVSILGAEAGNLALKLMATGGVYLGGGIPPRVLPALENRNFMQSFLHKGRLSSVLIRTPVHVILNPKSALLGSACYGLSATGG